MRLFRVDCAISFPTWSNEQAEPKEGPVPRDIGKLLLETSKILQTLEDDSLHVKHIPNT
jgi:hypothetical protein